MLNIQKMIEKAMARTCSPVALLVNYSEVGFSAALVEVEILSGAMHPPIIDTLTLESDRSILLFSEGATVELAVAALDVICSEDFR